VTSVHASTLVVVSSPTPWVVAHVKPASVKPLVKPSVKQLIKQYAVKYAVSPSLALSIASCESQFNPRARNPNSTAKGVYQFTQGSWRGYSIQKWGKVRDVFNPSYNAELAMYVISLHGTSPWLASRGCWG
jgi:soluble lytic murein transglycosylase-like protein